jgi:hypothetical protein
MLERIRTFFGREKGTAPKQDNGCCPRVSVVLHRVQAGIHN